MRQSPWVMSSARNLPPANLRMQDFAELASLGALWGASFLFMRVAAPEFGPVPLMAMRLAFAAALTAPLLWRVRRHTAMRAGLVPMAVLGLFNSALPFVLFAYAVLILPAGFGALLNATAAWWAALIGWAVLGVALSRRGLLGILVGTVGVAAMVAHRLSESRADAPVALATAAALTATACYGACVHYTRRRLAEAPPAAVAAGSQMAAALMLVLPAWWLWPSAPPSPQAWLAVCALGAMCTALAYALYFRLIARIGAERVMTVTMLVPAFGVAFGVMLLDEPITAGIAVGGALVLLGTGLSLSQRPTTTKASP
jgi:drug/metabolite transporter (DMT)-like permease